MNYTKIYNQIIERGKTRKLESYTEKHHIIPKCVGGTNDKENIVVLTAREHYICHKLLTEIYPDSTGLRYSVFRMCHDKNHSNGMKRKYRVGSREYQRIRENMFNDKYSKKMRESRLGTICSSETRKKMSEIGKNRIYSEETREKMSVSKTGVSRIPFTKAHKQNMIDNSFWKGKIKPLVECPHCGTVGGNVIMKRWHFDNCKLV